MRTATGVALAIAVMTAAGCSSSPQPTPTVTTTGDAHTRSVELVQTVIPGATTAQAEDMMKSACVLIKAHPTPAGVLSVRSDLIRQGLGSAVEVTTILGAAVAGECPEHLDALKGI